MSITIAQIAEICHEALKIHHDCIGDEKIIGWHDDPHKEFKIMCVAAHFKTPVEVNASPESNVYFIPKLISVFKDVLTAELTPPTKL